MARHTTAGDDRHTAALVTGMILGGLAGIGLALWKAPMSGAQLRAKIAEQAESMLFKVIGMDEWQAAEPVSAQTAPAPVVTTPPVAASASVSSVHDEEGGALPPTFRGEPLSERPKIEEAEPVSAAAEHPQVHEEKEATG